MIKGFAKALGITVGIGVGIIIVSLLSTGVTYLAVELGII